MHQYLVWNPIKSQHLPLCFCFFIALKTHFAHKKYLELSGRWQLKDQSVLTVNKKFLSKIYIFAYCKIKKSCRLISSSPSPTKNKKVRIGLIFAQRGRSGTPNVNVMLYCIAYTCRLSKSVKNREAAGA